MKGDERVHTSEGLVAVGVALGLSLLFGCSAGTPVPEERGGPEEESTLPPASEAPQAGVMADVISVEVSGDLDVYQFSVGISSPDEGCHRYADWWEVLTEGGDLIYRRVLLHSHVDEQPFVRSGGPVTIGPDTVVWVRAHMHPAGYGGRVLRGSVAGGFHEAAMEAGFAEHLESEPPLPGDCDF